MREKQQEEERSSRKRGTERKKKPEKMYVEETREKRDMTEAVQKGSCKGYRQKREEELTWKEGKSWLQSVNQAEEECSSSYKLPE